MATTMTIVDPAKAKTYFEAKMAFTTGPVELERMMTQEFGLMKTERQQPRP